MVSRSAKLYWEVLVFTTTVVASGASIPATFVKYDFSCDAATSLVSVRVLATAAASAFSPLLKLMSGRTLNVQVVASVRVQLVTMPASVGLREASVVIRGSSMVAQTIWAERAPTIGSRVAGWAASSARTVNGPADWAVPGSEPPQAVRPAPARARVATSANGRRDRKEFMGMYGRPSQRWTRHVAASRGRDARHKVPTSRYQVNRSNRCRVRNGRVTHPPPACIIVFIPTGMYDPPVALTLTREHDGRVARVRYDNAARGNCFDDAALRELVAAMETAAADDPVP